MAENPEREGRKRVSRWTIAAWTAATLILLLPLIMMQFTDEVDWDVTDFAVFGALITGGGAALQLAARKTDNAAYRWGVGLAVGAAFFLFWVNGAVGIIGNDDNDANMMYYGVLAVGFIGSLIARFEPQGMARAMIAVAGAMGSVAVIALIARWGSPESGPGEILFLTGFFVTLFVGSALLFRISTGNTTRDVTKLEIHKLMSKLIIVIGVVLMTYMVLVEDEPGFIPPLLIVLGTVWYVGTRIRIRSHR
jgi:peptidoglycan/LPS O-acetylase OafA/YrhL